MDRPIGTAQDQLRGEITAIKTLLLAVIEASGFSDEKYEQMITRLSQMEAHHEKAPGFFPDLFLKGIREEFRFLTLELRKQRNALSPAPSKSIH